MERGIRSVHPFQRESNKVSRWKRIWEYREPLESQDWVSYQPSFLFYSSSICPFLHLSLATWMFPGAIGRTSTIPASPCLQVAVLRLVWYHGLRQWLLESNRPRFKSGPCHFLARWPWESCLASLSHNSAPATGMLVLSSLLCCENDIS